MPSGGQESLPPGPRPPHCLDQAAGDFWLLPRVKRTPEGNLWLRFRTQCSLDSTVEDAHERGLRSRFGKLQEQWEKCIQSKGEDSEGDSWTVTFTMIIVLLKHIPYCFITPLHIWMHLPNSLNETQTNNLFYRWEIGSSKMTVPTQSRNLISWENRRKSGSLPLLLIASQIFPVNRQKIFTKSPLNVFGGNLN